MMPALPDVIATVSRPADRAVAKPIRAANLTRSVFHLASGLAALALLHLLPSRGWVIAASGALAASGWSMEVARRRSKAIPVAVTAAAAAAQLLV